MARQVLGGDTFIELILNAVQEMVSEERQHLVIIHLCMYYLNVKTAFHRTKRL